MAGTAKNYQSSKTVSGPVDIWFKLAVPGAGAAPTLHTDGTPESVANPQALHAGMLKSGGGLSTEAEIQEKTSDNLTAPYETTLLTSSMVIKGDMLQAADSALLATITLGATAATVSGKTGITMGAITAPAYTCLAAIWQQKTASKYVAAIIYNGYNSKGFELSLNRSEDAVAEVEFKSLAVTSRATADQVGAIWIDT